MLWAEGGKETRALATLPHWPWFMPFPRVDDDVKARAEPAARTHVVTDPR